VVKRDAVMADELRIYLRDEGEIVRRFLRIKEHMGLKNDTEVVRFLTNDYWDRNKDMLQPALEHFNLSEKGVCILDRTLADKNSRGRIVDVHFKPDMVWCEYCQSAACEHVKFALDLPEVQEIMRRKSLEKASREVEGSSRSA
jgi:hypothetical protein